MNSAKPAEPSSVPSVCPHCEPDSHCNGGCHGVYPNGEPKDDSAKPAGEPRINGEAPNAHNLLAALIDIYDDAQSNPPESRCYIDSAWPDILREARAFIAAAPAPAEPAAPVLAEVQRLLTDAIPFRLGLIERSSSRAEAEVNCERIREMLQMVLADLGATAS